MSINRAALPCLGLSFPASSFKDTETGFSSLPCPPEVPTGVADAALLHGLHPPRNLEASLNSSLTSLHIQSTTKC